MTLNRSKEPYYANNTVERIKRMTIIFEKELVKMPKFVLNYLRYRYSDQTIIYSDGKLIKSSFDLESF